TRMADLYFILQVMSTIENDGYYNLDRELENNISKFNDKYEDSALMFDLLTNSLDIVEQLDFDDDSIWFRKSNFFTLLVEMAFYLRKHYNISNVPDIKNALLSLERNILSNKNKENEFGSYYGAMYSGTNNRKSRVIRGDIFKKHIFPK
ncbi:DUF262 domain-containing protein, partial [Rodentibacter pneumotropicus]